MYSLFLSASLHHDELSSLNSARCILAGIPRILLTTVLDKLQELLPKALANLQFRAGKHLAVFIQNGTGDIPAGRFGNGKEEDRALQSCGLEGSGNQHIRVNDQTEGKP